MWRLTNHVRRYAWGSTTEIPRLLGIPPDGRPQAELWLGAHPGAPSRVCGPSGRGRPRHGAGLDTVIAADPVTALGADIAESFGALPFLLKFLAVERPLSLQAHPRLDRARAGFAAEEAAGIPVDAPHRTYRDANHKPELVLALSGFEALCGFRAPAAAAADLDGLDAPLAAALRTALAAADPSDALRGAMTLLLTLPARDRFGLVAAVAAELAQRAGGCPAPRLRAVLGLAEHYPGDPGVIVSLLLNHVVLSAGEALFLPAGTVHAYLRGSAVEVMAASDNVLRAGLTAKHVAPGELLDAVEYAVLPVPYVAPTVSGGLREYRPRVDEFALAVAEPEDTAVRLPAGPAIALVLDGGVELRASSGAALTLRGGESAFLSASAGPVLAAGRARVVVAAPAARPVRAARWSERADRWSAVHLR